MELVRGPEAEALKQAIDADDAGGVQAAGADPNAVATNGLTLLHVAMDQRPEIVGLLLKAGADANAVFQEEETGAMTPIDRSEREGNDKGVEPEKVVEVLRRAGGKRAAELA